MTLLIHEERPLQILRRFVVFLHLVDRSLAQFLMIDDSLVKSLLLQQLGWQREKTSA